MPAAYCPSHLLSPDHLNETVPASLRSGADPLRGFPVRVAWFLVRGSWFACSKGTVGLKRLNQEPETRNPEPFLSPFFLREDISCLYKRWVNGQSHTRLSLRIP